MPAIVEPAIVEPATVEPAAQNGRAHKETPSPYAPETHATKTARSPLALRGMTVSYGENRVVFSLDITVTKGQMTAIIGPNSARKFTLLKAALGIVKPKMRRSTPCCRCSLAFASCC